MPEILLTPMTVWMHHTVHCNMIDNISRRGCFLEPFHVAESAIVVEMMPLYEIQRKNPPTFWSSPVQNMTGSASEKKVHVLPWWQIAFLQEFRDKWAQTRLQSFAPQNWWTACSTSCSLDFWSIKAEIRIEARRGHGDEGEPARNLHLLCSTSMRTF